MLLNLFCPLTTAKGLALKATVLLLSSLNAGPERFSAAVVLFQGGRHS